MTDCIYTGANLFITNYGAYTPADIYRAGDALALRINPESCWSYKEIESNPATHILTLPERDNQYFWPFMRDEFFTAVVPLDAILPTPHARKPILPEIH